MAIKCEATVASCISYETYLAQTPKLEDGIKRNLCLVSVLFKSKPYKAEAKNEEGSWKSASTLIFIAKEKKSAVRLSRVSHFFGKWKMRICVCEGGRSQKRGHEDIRKLLLGKWDDDDFQIMGKYGRFKRFNKV